MILSREFHFDAAHFLPHYPDGHPNRRLHGHSFRVRVSVAAKPAPETGQIIDLDELHALTHKASAQLDHMMLNEIEGLSVPTLENICLWLWNRLIPDLPHLAEIEVARDSLGQSCRYNGDNG